MHGNLLAEDRWKRLANRSLWSLDENKIVDFDPVVTYSISVDSHRHAQYQST